MTPLPLAAAQDAPGLRIGEMAKISGFSVKTIRFYCDQGLLHTARSEGRYRIQPRESCGIGNHSGFAVYGCADRRVGPHT
jgi:predicted site-specific integrase-resolvase